MAITRKITYKSDLKDFAPLDTIPTTSQVFRGTLQSATYYLKLPAQQIESSGKLSCIRIINEAIAGTITEMVNQALGNQFLTPTHSLVLSDGIAKEPVGLLVSHIDFENSDDYSLYSAKELEEALNSKLGFITAIRYFLDEPDGKYNLGFHFEAGKKTLVSFDYGLANFFELKKQDALTNDEKTRVPQQGGREYFALNLKNILTGVLQPIAKDVEYLDNPVELLAVHGFTQFNKYANQKHSAEDQGWVKKLLNDSYLAQCTIVKVLTDPNFKDNICERLCSIELSHTAKLVFLRTVQAWIEKAVCLGKTLETVRTLSSQDLIELIGREHATASPVYELAITGKRKTPSPTNFGLFDQRNLRSFARLERPVAVARTPRR